MKGGEQMENQKKRYRVLSIVGNSEMCVASFDQLDQARICVQRIQTAYNSMPQYRFTRYPRLVIVDGQSNTSELAGECVSRTTRDKLEQMKKIDEENERRMNEWSKKHETAPHS